MSRFWYGHNLTLRLQRIAEERLPGRVPDVDAAGLATTDAEPLGLVVEADGTVHGVAEVAVA